MITIQSLAIFLSASLSVVGYYAVDAVVHGKIVGGVDTEMGEYPFMVSLMRRGRHFCGAAIVSDKFLMTAAHCLCRYEQSLWR